MNFKVLYIINALFFVLLLSCKSKVNNADVEEVDVESNVVKSIEKPAFETHDFNSFEKYLHFNDEKIYVVNFWATWCKPCVAELPYFENLYKKYKEKNVEVILVSLDFPKKVDKSLIPFMEKNDLKSKVVLLDDPKQNDWIPKVDENWSGAIPATVIYNKDKRAFFEQSFTYEELDTQLNKFLK